MLAILVLTLGWVVPAHLGMSALMDVMRRQTPSPDVDAVYLRGCVLLAGTWILAVLVVYTVIAVTCTFESVRSGVRKFAQQPPRQRHLIVHD